jgi:hypothetical protein
MGTDHSPRDKFPTLPTSLSRFVRMPFERMNLRLVAANMLKTFIRCSVASVQLWDTSKMTQYHGRTAPSVGMRMLRSLAGRTASHPPARDKFDLRIYVPNPLQGPTSVPGTTVR